MLFLVFAIYSSRKARSNIDDQKRAKEILRIVSTVLPLYLIALAFIYQNYTPGMFTKTLLVIVLIFLVPCVLLPTSILVRRNAVLISASFWALAGALLTIIFVMWMVITETVAPK